MTECWLCVTNEENWDAIKKHKVWGVPERNRRLIEGVQPGDFLVFYVLPKKRASEVKRIRGIFKAISEPFESSEIIFSWSEFGRKEVFPHRVKLEPELIPEEPLEFKKLVPKLKFITNKKMWSGHLRQAMRTIPKEDFELIRNKIKP